MKPEKAEKFSRVGSSILKIMAQGGARSVNHSQVARLSGVSRGWIYKYVGASAETLITFATDHFGKALLAVGGQEKPKKGEALRRHAFESTWKIIDFFAEHPEALEIYFRYAGTKTPLGEKIKAFEKRQIEDFAAAVAQASGKSGKGAHLMSELLILLWTGLSFRNQRLGLSERYNRKELSEGLSELFKYGHRFFSEIQSPKK